MKDILLTTFSNSVNPLYYVTFTTATLCASFILFGGFNTSDAVTIISLLSGFLVTFAGVYLLNLSRGDPNGHKLVNGRPSMDVSGTDMISSIQTRLSMQSRRSFDPHRRLSVNSLHGDREGLMRGYDEESGAFGLTELAEESDEDDIGRPMQSTNGRKGGYGNSIELQERKSDS